MTFAARVVHDRLVAPGATKADEDERRAKAWMILMVVTAFMIFMMRQRSK
jgi:hypothetical protein